VQAAWQASLIFVQHFVQRRWDGKNVVLLIHFKGDG